MRDQAPPHVLVVDDHAELAERLAEMVELAGFRASSARGGKEGIAAFVDAQAAGSPFALIITDLSMAGLSGLAVAAAVKNESPSTPVVLLTAYDIHPDHLPQYVDAILTKPPAIEDLRSTLTRLTAQL
jgi:CheY-like chemotaxis protein